MHKGLYDCVQFLWRYVFLSYSLRWLSSTLHYLYQAVSLEVVAFELSLEDWVGLQGEGWRAKQWGGDEEGLLGSGKCTRWGMLGGKESTWPKNGEGAVASCSSFIALQSQLLAPSSRPQGLWEWHRDARSGPRRNCQILPSVNTSMETEYFLPASRGKMRRK